MAERDFKVTATRREPFAMTIEATDGTSESFTCKGSVPGTKFQELMDNLAGASVQSPQVEAFLILAMGEEEYRRYREFVDDPAHEIDSIAIAEVIMRMIGAYSARPIKLPSPSGLGQEPNGDGSKEDSPSPESS